MDLSNRSASSIDPAIAGNLSSGITKNEQFYDASFAAAAGGYSGRWFDEKFAKEFADAGLKVNDPRYGNDEAYTKEVTAKFQQVYGTGPAGSSEAGRGVPRGTSTPGFADLRKTG